MRLLMRLPLALASTVFALALSCALSGCGDDATAEPDPLAVVDYCAAWSDAACEAASRCACGVDATMCAMLAPTLCPLAEGSPTRMGVDDGSIRYDPLDAGRFVARLRSAACDTRPLSCGTGALCIGLSGEGGACEATAACAAPLVCLASRCVTPAEIGGACTDDLGCTSGHCDGGACAEKVALGGACSGDSQCATGRCDFATERCRELEPLDALCTRNEECASGYCERVELSGGHCKAVTARLARGAPCSTDDMCADGACVSGACAAALCDEIM